VTLRETVAVVVGVTDDDVDGDDVAVALPRKSAVAETDGDGVVDGDNDSDPVTDGNVDGDGVNDCSAHGVAAHISMARMRLLQPSAIKRRPCDVKARPPGPQMRAPVPSPSK
jgi:hypothetical protein